MKTKEFWVWGEARYIEILKPSWVKECLLSVRTGTRQPCPLPIKHWKSPSPIKVQQQYHKWTKIYEFMMILKQLSKWRRGLAYQKENWKDWNKRKIHIKLNTKVFFLWWGLPWNTKLNLNSLILAFCGKVKGHCTETPFSMYVLSMRNHNFQYIFPQSREHC